MLKTVTLLFPGQGSQYVGMGKGLTSSDSLDWADGVLSVPLKQVMREGPEETLTLTKNAQAAILTHSLALFEELSEFLREKNLGIERVLGHSVGEYSALCVARVFTFEEALTAVYKRGLAMEEAVPPGKGGMMAVLKVPDDVVMTACREVSGKGGLVVPANYNSPGQIVISGHTLACRQAIEWLKQHHAAPFRSVALSVSAPFHSPLMEPSAKKLKAHLDTLPFPPNTIPYIANINAREYPTKTLGKIIKENLYKQVCGSVLWSQSFKTLPDQTFCIECGPGRVLAGLAKKINPRIPVVSLDRKGAFRELSEKIEALKKQG